MAPADARIRAFAAIEIGDAARGALSELIGRLRGMPARVSWVRPENLHVTLRFLGMVEPDRVETFAEGMRAALKEAASFEAAVRGVGVFPNARRPSVIWAGLEGDRDTFAAIHASAESSARAIGLEPETRPFVPHITLGRVRREAAVANVAPHLESERGFQAGAFMVEAVSLFSSELTPQGARYTRLHRLTLDGLPRAGGI